MSHSLKTGRDKSHKGQNRRELSYVTFCGATQSHQSCAGSRPSLLPCRTINPNNIKVWLSVGPYFSQGSAWVSSSTMDGSVTTPDLLKGSPET